MARFVVVTLPAEDTLLGALTYRTAARVELFARREEDAGGHWFAFTLAAEGLDADQADQAERHLVDTRVDLQGRLHHWDRWWAAGWIPADNLAPPSLRLLAAVPARPAWLVLQGGIVQVRLAPKQQDVGAFAADVDRVLQDAGVVCQVHVADLDEVTYDAGMEALAHVPRRRPLVVA